MKPTKSTAEHTPGPYTYTWNPVGKAYRLIGADGYGTIAELFNEANASHLADALNHAPETAAERDRLRESNAELVAALELAVATIERLERHAPGSQNGTIDVARAALARHAKGE